MTSRYSVNFFGISTAGKFAGIFSFALFLFAGLISHAQSYYYLESRSNNTSDTFYTFLTLLPDGSATARIRAKEPVSKNEFVFEINLRDSTITDPIKHDSKLILYTVGAPELTGGFSDKYVFKPRFVFEKQVDSSGISYTPKALEIPDPKDKWTTVQILYSRSYDDAALKQQVPLVSGFYTPDEPFYIFLTENQSRGIIDPRPEKMFLIVVANSNDPKIGASTKKDFEKVTILFNKIAEDLGIQQVEKTYISGDRFSKAAVEQAIAQLNPSPIDIVVFYFSGHGFRFSKDKSEYPRMSFRTQTNTDITVHNLGLENIYEKIRSKNPKFALVIGDCCNEDVGEEPRLGSGMIASKGFTFTNFNAANAQKLFFPPMQTSLIAASANVKQLSVGNPELGGFFTHFFAAALYQKLYSFAPLSPDWWKIILEAKERTRIKAISAYCENIKTRCIQTPIFKKLPPF